MADVEQQLISLFRALSAADRQALTAFAEFLSSRSVSGQAVPVVAPEPVAEPETIERPAQESVVAGLKRLSKTYPMLDKTEMLSATSDLVATHIMQGTDTTDVIDKLEDIFRSHYETLKAG